MGSGIGLNALAGAKRLFLDNILGFDVENKIIAETRKGIAVCVAFYFDLKYGGPAQHCNPSDDLQPVGDLVHVSEYLLQDGQFFFHQRSYLVGRDIIGGSTHGVDRQPEQLFLQ